MTDAEALACYRAVTGDEPGARDLATQRVMASTIQKIHGARSQVEAERLVMEWLKQDECDRFTKDVVKTVWKWRVK
jgi:hypothetical protein